jgi:uncharacterized protein (DUF849 family)
MNATWKEYAGERVVIMAAPNGARRSQAEHPTLPITAAELSAEAVALEKAGVSVLHLHVRDDAGRHTLDTGAYREAITAIKDRVGDELILQVTTEAVGRYKPSEQMAVIRELRPEAVSLSLREICPDAGQEACLAEFCAWLKEAGIWPQYILYTENDVRRFDALCQRGVIADEAPFILFVLGRYADASAGRVEDLDRLLGYVDASALPWAVCCFGPAENEVMRAALERGGHVRIGFENNILLADGSPAPDNATLIREFVAGLEDQARQPATARELRLLRLFGSAT